MSSSGQNLPSILEKNVQLLAEGGHGENPINIISHLVFGIRLAETDGSWTQVGNQNVLPNRVCSCSEAVNF